MKDDFLSKGMDFSNVIDVDKDNTDDVNNKRKQKGFSDETRRKEAKSSRLVMLEDALSQWSESMSAKTELSKVKTTVLKAKAERYTLKASQATSPLYDPYSIDTCMELLDSIEDIANKVYNKVFEKFKDEDWRCMFIKMPLFRRKDWLTSLE
ncbi:hypothetical protein HN51_017994 [Arachis hypogaea]